MITFGPVPSRRLGRSLGVNNIPYKICTYSCVYCQVGRTLKMEINRRSFYSPDEIYREVKLRVEKLNECIDFITFVPDGEPTLDTNLSKEVELIKEFKIPIAIITNSSLMWREDVRADLLEFDLVSLKIDAVSEGIWKKINKPHKDLRLVKILEGILEFGKEFKGKILTETMLIDGIDYGDEFEKIAKFLKELKPVKSYIAVPTRPPAERWVKPAKESVINKAFQIFSEALNDKIEFLIEFEGTSFAITDEVERDILSIASVHPIREEAMRELLKKAKVGWSVVEKLIKEGKLVRVEYNGRGFYMRKLS